ncbi:MAG: hypothetical protein ABFR36_07940 [Acidobacteriota bacterium]
MAKVKRKVINISIGERTKMMLWEVAKYFKIRESAFIEKAMTDLENDEVRTDFKKFCELMGYKNIERSGEHKPLFIQESLIYRIKKDHFEYNLKNQTIFIKYLIYYYYNKFVESII